MSTTTLLLRSQAPPVSVCAPPAVHEAWTGELAFGDLTAAQIFFQLVQQEGGVLTPEGCDPRYAAVMEGCLHREAAQRWCFAKVLAALRSLLAEENAKSQAS